MGVWTKAAVIARAKEIGAKHGGRVTLEVLAKEGGVKYGEVRRLFGKGGYPKLRRAAGLREPETMPRIPDETLMEEFHRVAGVVGGIPNLVQVQRFTGRSPRIVRRLGRRKEIRARYEAWLKARGLREPWVGSWKGSGEGKGAKGKRGTPEWRGGRGYGAPIDFRGIRHAPVNELGVVALFGALAEELGYLIEAVRVRFPDCEAKRLVDARAGRWEKCRIEFEYRSSGFKAHRHDPKGCDVIVCWEDDWADCPLEVVELKREVERVREGKARAGAGPSTQRMWATGVVERAAPGRRGGARGA